jgi:hypothetical protein
MPGRLDKQQLIWLVQEILRSEEEIGGWSDLISRSVPCPIGYFMDLIYWPQQNGLGNNPSAEEIVEKALSYKPMLL